MQTYRENYYKALSLVLEVGSKTKQKLLESHLNNKCQVLTDFINVNQHELFHLYTKHSCCQCVDGKVYNKDCVLRKKQMSIIFDKKMKDSKHDDHNQHKDPFCCSQAHFCLQPTDLDITILSCILKNICYDLFLNSCFVDKSSGSVESFLSQNKHTLFHIWKPVEKMCCLGPTGCKSTYRGKIYDSQWNTIFEKNLNLTPCPNNNNDACSYCAKTGLNINELNHGIVKIIVENCCELRAAVDRLTEMRNELAHNTDAQLSDMDFNRIWTECEKDILCIATFYKKELEAVAEIKVINQKPFDESLFSKMRINIMMELKDQLSVEEEISKLQSKVNELQTDIKLFIEMTVRYNNEDGRRQSEMAAAADTVQSKSQDSGIIKWIFTRFRNFFGIAPPDRTHMDIKLSDDEETRFDKDRFTCGACKTDFTILEDFLRHRDECKLRNIQLTNSQRKKRESSRHDAEILIKGIGSKWKEDTRHFSMENRGILDIADVEIEDAKEGSLVFLAKIASCVLSTKEMITETIDKFLQNLFSKCPLDDKDINVEVNIKIEQEINASMDVDGDVFYCGLCKGEMKTIRAYLIHKSTNCVREREDIDPGFLKTDTMAIGRLGRPAMLKECQELETKPLDPSNKEIMTEIDKLKLEVHEEIIPDIRSVKGSMESLKISYDELQCGQDAIKDDVKRLKTSLKDTVPWNIRDKACVLVGIPKRKTYDERQDSKISRLDNPTEQVDTKKENPIHDGKFIEKEKEDLVYPGIVICDGFVVDCIVGRKLDGFKSSYKEIKSPNNMPFTNNYYSLLIYRKRLNMLGRSNDHLESWKQIFFLSIEANHELLCRYMLAIGQILNENIDILMSALQSSIERQNFRCSKAIAWHITRLFAKSLLSFEKVFDIWPGFVCRCNEPGKLERFCSTNIKIVVEVENEKPNSLPDHFHNYEIQYKVMNGFSEEGKSIVREINKIYSGTKPQTLPEGIKSELAEMYFKNHSKLSLVSPSLLKSRLFKENQQFDQTPCIQLYCRVKGIIPVGEDHFPASILSVPTDVLEGHSELLVKNIRIGSEVGAVNDGRSGTLGGFVFYRGFRAFLTCAHVLLSNACLFNSAERQKSHQQIVEIQYRNPSETGSPTVCGKLINHMFPPQRASDGTSIDAAIVILDNHDVMIEPNDILLQNGVHMNISDLGMKSVYLNDNCVDHKFFGAGMLVATKCAGVVSEIQEKTDIICHEDEKIIKFEEFSQVFDRLLMQNPKPHDVDECVHLKQIIGKYDEKPIDIPPTVTLYNQISFRNISFQQGDSGTCIYIKDSYNGMTGCIGMAIASHPNGGCIVTPLKAILSAFNMM